MKLVNRAALFVLVIALLCAGLVAGAAADPAPLPFVEGSWTLVLLPDTQLYAQDHPEIFTAQTRWIVDNREARNIRFVLHEGDITNDNSPAQWGNARYSLSLLDGLVPYALAPGNHDYGKGAATRDTLLDVFFPVALFDRLPTFGGTFEPGKLENSYYLFSAGGRDWLAIALEWGPRDEVLKWADGVLRKYPKRSAMIVTHAYLYYDDTRYDHVNRPDQSWSPHGYPTAKLPGGVNDGQEMWDKLIASNPNVAFVFCGHVIGDGAGRLSSKGAHGNIVHQLLANYQMRPDGGEGYLRLVEFLPDGKTVQVKTYSPHLDRYLTDDQQQFTLELPPSPNPGRR
jgi:3',5'-cyclic AMP phosphodiesterase CpdA